MKDKSKKIKRKNSNWVWTHFIIEAFCGHEFMHTKTMLVSEILKVDDLLKKLKLSRHTKYKRIKNPSYRKGTSCKYPGRPLPDRCLNKKGRLCPFFLWAKVDDWEYKTMLEAWGKVNKNKKN